MSLFDQAFENILKVEGDKYTNHPQDLGGPTKFGISLKAYNDFFSTSGDAVTIQNITRETARSIYKTFFWYRMQLDRVATHSPQIALILFDQAVNRGMFGCTRLVQKSINEVWKQPVLIEDGVFGEKTLSEIEKLPTIQLGLQIFKNAQISYVRIVKNDPEQIVFFEGWLRRTHEILNTLLEGIK